MIPTETTSSYWVVHIPHITRLEFPIVLTEFPFKYLIPTKISNRSYILYNTLEFLIVPIPIQIPDSN